jgi:type I restriction-modification system DNA methylase subunit
MSLFQKSVISKYLKSQNKLHLATQWTAFKTHFHNATIQDNIRNSKEEQYQEGFLRDLFVKILGYTLNPDADFNLTTEYKNVKDSKKADGAIIINTKVEAVIELKGTNTTDLGKIESQAFGYKNNQPDCKYIITSNFEKIRFYIDNAIEHIEFNLFTLTETDFELLYLLLGFENLSKGIAKNIKDESVSQEDVITKKLYKDYSLFKRELHQNLVAINPDFEPLELFKKSQKLLDRFLFLFFGEDRHLLPPNSVRLILSDWKDLQERDVEIPLYERFKKYFEYLNTGFKGKRYDVFAYNGGLFKPDEVLDTILIDDELLYRHTYKLAEYDFASEVDVNILGHIFENSLNELDEIKAQLEGAEIDKTKTKRKKDGVFYTPKYITKYIVDNTIGKLCNDKKTDLQLLEDDYITDKKRQKKTMQLLVEKLDAYRNWLLQLTICDPACGSGAFLNQALDFLINEHKYIDELQAKLFGDAMVLSDVEKSILENNLFGVDLNEESVEIAKLSLWLRTAQPNRKLNDLNSNIKCGNSLIDDPEVAGEKAFNWQSAFPQVFKEKQKKAFHITTAIHDSRTSQRMIDYKVREKRAMGTMPEPQVNYLTDDDEMVIAETVLTLVKEQHINILGFTICKDHIHIVLVCEEEEVDEIVRKIKGRTAREVNKSNGINPVINIEYHSNNGLNPIALEKAEKSVPLWTQKFGCKEILDEDQLYNTINYIQTNRTKHNLPNNSNKGFKPLVDSISCSYEYAFREEYKGGFDVVIGNPPYVQVKDNFYNEYATEKCGDLYAFFFEKGININKPNGIFSYITPSLFIKGMKYISLREFILNNSKIIEINDLGDKVFDDVQMPTAITILRNQKENNQNWDSFINGADLITVIDNNSIKISEISKIMRGLEIGKDKVNISNNEVKFLTGEDISRYYVKNFSFISNTIFEEYKKDETFFKGKRILVRETGNRLTTIFIEDNETQQNRSLYSVKINNEKLFDYKYIIALLNSKIIQYYYQSKFSANTDVFPKIRIGQVKELPIKNISLSEQLPFIEKADLMLTLNKELQEESEKFQRTMQRKFEPTMGLNPLHSPTQKESDSTKGLYPLHSPTQKESDSTKGLYPLPKKLQEWYLLSYSEFIKELAKKKVTLSLSQEAEWESYFMQEQQKTIALKSKIEATDKEIDAMVYELYGLSEEEIKIVEGS